MGKDFFSNAELRQAALLVRQAMLDSLPDPEDCHYEESPEFRERIRPLFARVRRMELLRRAGSLAAMIALTVLLMGGALLAVNSEVRAEFFQWVRDVYKNSVIYRYFNEPQMDELPEYTFSELPEGYVKVRSSEDNTARISLFHSDRGFITLYYQHQSGGSLMRVLQSDYIHEAAEIKGQPADFYTALKSGEENELVWVDESTGITFKISARLDKAAMIELANSLKEAAAKK